MTGRRFIWFIVVTIVLLGASYAFSNITSGSAVQPDASIDLNDSSAAAQMKSTDELLAFWRDRVQRDPRDFISLTYLGQTFLHKARETGDVANYTNAESAFRKALDLDSAYTPALADLAAARFAVHDFANALQLAQHLYSSDPSALQALATMGDAQLELGNYAEANSAYQKVAGGSTSPAVYSRLARLAWLQGHLDDARNLLRQTANETTRWDLTGEPAAWYEYQFAELEFSAGQVQVAESHYNNALALYPNYYFALVGLGKVRAAQNNYAEAIDYYTRAAAIIPQPDFLAALGDLYAVTGQPEKAQQQYDTIEFIAKLAAINQVIYNRQLALFYANHDRKLAEALSLSSNELSVRKDIYGYDAYAWTLYKNRRYSEAAKAMDQALRLGTKDALLDYHAGMINAALGNSQRAEELLGEALSINSHFDLLQSRIAQGTLEQLRGQSTLVPGLTGEGQDRDARLDRNR